MAISRRLLNDDESVVVSTRTHAKALIRPLLVLIVLALLWVVRPFLVWLTTTYTLTDQRLITRRGGVSRHGHDIPLSRVSDVAYEGGLLDRMLGCGTLVVSVASEQRVRLHDIPQVEQVHLRVQDLLHDGRMTEVVDPRDRERRGRR